MAVAIVVAAVLAFAGALDENGEGPPAGAVAQGGAAAGGALERVRPGLVAVTTTGRRGGTAGTGFMVDDAGHIVTSGAVLGDRREARVYAEGRTGPMVAELVGRDAATTLAVLRIPRDDARSVEPLELPDSLRVRPGEAVLAVGAPFLVEGATRGGVVSAVDRSVRARGGATVHGAIETDATTDARNAGGPLVDSDGRVLGVLLAPAAGTGAGYAVPADLAREVVAALEQRGDLVAASAGMRTETVDPGVAQLLGLPVEHGLLVRAVEPGGPAARAGVRPAPRGDPLAGDVVVAVGGQEVRRPGDVGRLLAGRRRRAAVPLVVVRDRQRLVLRVVPTPTRGGGAAR